ncbi:MAG: hypothetical protein JXQ27_15250 [Acidobacteria bacterium]|nr:hypothetical protein [Acidobacteriota bacterium]
MEKKSVHCPNCSAPLDLPVGEVEALCEYCSSRLRFVPGQEELEVVRTREEMKYRERVAVQKQILKNKMDQEEMDRWRSVAGRVAIAALPVVGDVAGRSLFGAAMNRGKGCFGCGCLAVLGALAALVIAALNVTA